MANKWEWKEELAKAHLSQADVGRHLGFKNPGQMSALVKLMIGGNTEATDYERTKWRDALDFIEYNKSKHKTKV